VNSLVWNGQHGVQIFFAVSGFLITSVSLRRWGTLCDIPVRDFYLMRFARIAPLLLLLLIVLSVLHFVGLKNFVISAKTGGLQRALFAALTFHVNVLEASRGYLPGSWDILWSLSVEEMFYLFFPIIGRFVGSGKLLIMLLISFVLAGPFARTVLAHGSEVWREYSYLGSMDAIALGCLTAIAVSRFRFPQAVLRSFTLVGLVLVSFILCLSGQSEKFGLIGTGLDMTLLALGSCMLIASTAQTNWKGHRMLIPLLQLGQRSYEVYLTHMFVVFTCFGVFVRAGSLTPTVPFLFVAVIIASALFGDIVARLYSEPLNRIIRSRWHTSLNSN
jgi:peptidoglycan/LPS O-acetylase OafA/YrhL